MQHGLDRNLIAYSLLLVFGDHLLDNTSDERIIRIRYRQKDGKKRFPEA